jgi:predicted  nucleic acid-binding Zn-ribbon protein
MQQCFEYLKTFDFDNVESLLWILNFVSFFPNLALNVSQISSDFETCKGNLLAKASLSTISTILKCDALKIESEDSLFAFLIEYSKLWKHESLPLFENVYFEYLNKSNVERFIELHSQFEHYFQFQLHSSIFESFLYLFQSKLPSVPKVRHLSHSVAKDVTSLFECRHSLSLHSENSKLNFTIKDLQTRNSGLQKIIDDLNYVLKGSQTKNSDLQTTIYDLHSKIRNSETNNSTGKKTIDDLNSNKCKLNSDIADLQLCNSTLRETVDGLNQDTQSLRTNASVLRKTINSLNSDINNFRRENSDLQQTIGNLKSEKFKLTSDIQSLQINN